MPTLTTAADLVALLDSPPAGFWPGIATDADGTLWDYDIGDELFLTVAARDDFRGDGLAHLRTWAERSGVPDAGSRAGGDLARALTALHRAGVIDTRTMCDNEVMSLAGRSPGDLDELVCTIALGAVARVRPVVRTLLTEARRRRCSVYVVTASLGIAVERALEFAGLPGDRVFGPSIAVRNGRLLAALECASPLFDGKRDVLRAASAWPPVIGLGDGAWDHTFLRECYAPVMVWPTHGLRVALRDVPHARELT